MKGAGGGGVATCKCSSEGREGEPSWLRLGAAVAGRIAEMQRRQKGEERKEDEERGDSAVHLSQMHGQALNISLMSMYMVFKVIVGPLFYSLTLISEKSGDI